MTKKYYTVAELATLLGISRIAVHKKIKKGEIPAEKIGRNYAISAAVFAGALSSEITAQQKKHLATGVAAVVKQYGETLKLLGKE